MVRKEKEDVDLCCGFSRKELQNLCKKYNLPANRSSTDMAESLAIYFEKNNNLNSVGNGVAGNRDGEASTSRVVTRTWDVSKDSYGNGLDRYREIFIQAAMAKEPLMILVDDDLQYQEQNGNGGLIDSAGASKKGPTENSEKDGRTDSRLENRKRKVDSGSSTSFKFDVESKEGISLSLDLDYNPSDWLKSLTDEVNVYDSLRRRKPPHSDNGINKDTESTKQKSSGKDKDANKDNAQLPSDHHSNGELSLASSVIEPCNGNKEGSDICKETNGHVLSIPDSLVPSQIVSSCVEPYSKSCRVHPVELDCVIPPAKKLRSDSVTVAAHSARDLIIEIPDDPSTEIVQKVGTSSAVVCPLGAGSKLSPSVAEAYHSNARSSPLKTSIQVDREFSSYSESFKFQYNGGKNGLPPNSFEQ